MHVAFVGHPYHKKTGSSGFFKQILEDAGIEYEIFADNYFYDSKSDILGELLDGNHDLVILWQTEYLAPPLVRAGKRVVAIPMYDAAKLHRPEFWKIISLVRVISFCRHMHDQLQTEGLDTHYFQFFPEAGAARPKPGEEGGKDAFVWIRRPWDGLDWGTTDRLMTSMGAENVHVHKAIDKDGQKREAPIIRPAHLDAFGLTESEWFENKEEYFQTLEKADIFVAPRYAEGIGFSFIEAMARGQCVVAANAPTMNEYIVNRENGFLFDPAYPYFPEKPEAEEIWHLGERARQTVERGHERWVRDVPRLLDLVLSPEKPKSRRRDDSLHLQERMDLFSAERRKEVMARVFGEAAELDDTGTAKAANDDAAVDDVAENTPAPAEASNDTVPAAGTAVKKKAPRLSVITVVLNDPEGLQQTIDSVAAQQDSDFEYVVADGASRIPTLEVIRDNASVIDRWWSEQDNGPYDAMQRAAEKVEGEYVLFLNAGDLLYADDTLKRIVDDLPEEADFGIGHHIWVRKDRTALYKRANGFWDTWETLQNGTVNQFWLSGIPAHQATVTRRSMLADEKYDLRFRVAADHEFLFRMRGKGATFHHFADIIALYHEGGYSSANFQRCQSEWYQLARMHSDNPSIDHLYSGQVGYRLPSNKDEEEEGKQIAIDYPKRNVRAELAGMIERRIRSYPKLHGFARNVWHKVSRRA